LRRSILAITAVVVSLFASQCLAADDQTPADQSTAGRPVIAPDAHLKAVSNGTQYRVMKFFDSTTTTPMDSMILDNGADLFITQASARLFFNPNVNGPYINGTSTSMMLHGYGGTITLANADTIVNGFGTAAWSSALTVNGAGTGNTTAGLTVNNSAGGTLLYVRNDGNVGVGTGAPASKLHVFSTVNADGVTVDGTTNPAVSLRNNGTVKGFLGLATAADAYFAGAQVNDLVLRSETGNIVMGRSGVGGLTIANSTVKVGTDFSTMPNPTYGGVMIGQYGGGATGELQFLGAAASSGYGYKFYGYPFDGSLRLQRRENSAAWSDFMTFTHGGQFGVGTMFPNTTMQIHTTAATDGELLALTNTANGTTGQTNLPMITFGSDAAAAAGTYYRFAKIQAIRSGMYAGNLQFSTMSSTNGVWNSPSISVDTNGYVGVRTPAPTVPLEVTGNAIIHGTLTATQVIGAVYQDVAEWVPATTKMAPGTVVVLNRERRNEVMPSVHAYDTAVAGVVSAQPGLILGVGSDSKAQIATTGRVKVHVDATAGAIGIGDLLVTSDKQGTAMKSQPVDLGGVQIHRPGTVIGKALEPLPNGEGEILVLLSLQ